MVEKHINSGLAMHKGQYLPITTQYRSVSEQKYYEVAREILVVKTKLKEQLHAAQTNLNISQEEYSQLFFDLCQFMKRVTNVAPTVFDIHVFNHLLIDYSVTFLNAYDCFGLPLGIVY